MRKTKMVTILTSALTVGASSLQAAEPVMVENFVRAESEPGTYELTAGEGGTRFALLTVRTFFNADGYLEANDLGINSYNNFSAKPNEDGSYTIRFGGCDDGRANCLPFMPGWNYVTRMYEPREEILDGSWTFPEVQPAR